jgi:hypothetical protein
MIRLRTHLRFSVRATLLGAMAFVGIATTLASNSRAGTPPTYRIDFHAISAGGQSLRGRCYRVSATVGQVATGYSGVDSYSLIAGYWQPAPPAAADEIFFNEFEVC